MVTRSGRSDPTLRPMGEEAVLLELDSLDEVLLVHRALAETPLAGLVDLVPAARTVLAVTGEGGPTLAAVGAWLSSTARRSLESTSDDGRLVEGTTEPTVVIPVRYDGVDLEDTAALLGLETAELVALHTGSDWTVAFSGFAPGFGYLVTDHARLTVPRLNVPRISIPAGSVALAGAFSGVYPRSSPGGWRIIGTTDAVLWDVASTPPALLVPGHHVRFEAVAP